MELISKRNINFCRQCTYAYEVGKLGKCRCGWYIDHGSGRDPIYIPENVNWFLYMRRGQTGPDGHYRDEVIRLVEERSVMGNRILLVDKELNPKRVSVLKPSDDVFWILSIDKSIDEMLIYDEIKSE